MGLSLILFAIIAITVVANTIQQIQAAKAAKKDTTTRAVLEQNRVTLQAQERNLEQDRDAQRLQRAARASAANILNRAVNAGLTSVGNSTLRASANAIEQNLLREQEFSSQTADLASRGDAITSAQINLAKNANIQAAQAQQISAILSGIGALASAGSTASKAGAFDFGSTDSGRLADGAFAS